MLTARQENVMTLAAALGVHEDIAGELLKCRVTVTHDSQCAMATAIACHVRLFLDRMIEEPVDDRHARAVEVVIGNAKPTGLVPTKVYVHIGPDRIIVDDDRLGASTVNNPPMHGVFAILAACYAAARTTQKIIFGQSGILDPIVISPEALLGEDLGFVTNQIDLSDGVVLAGAGAVANGFLYGLSPFNVTGKLHITDPKKIAPGILNRCIFYVSSDVGYAKSTQLVLRVKSKFPNLQLIDHELTVNELIKHKLEQHRVERLIVTVDSRRARRSLQAEFPREVYDASTTGIDEVVLHFNRRPSPHACMSCIYRETEGEISHEAHVAEALGATIAEVRSGFILPDSAQKIARKYPSVPMSDIVGRAYDTLFKQLCGVGKLKASDDRQVLAPFSFVPILAGTYLALELVRRIARGAPDRPYNYWRISPWRSPNQELQQLRGARRTCEFCSNPILQSVEEQIWSER